MTFATEMPATSGKADPFFYTVVFAAVSNVDVPVSIAPQVGANPNVELPAEAPASAPAYVSGTLGDPSDPAAQGLNFSVAASDADAAGLSVSASSSDESVAKVSLSGSGARRTLKITPQKVGKSTVAVTVADGARSASYTIAYAASQAAKPTASTRFYSGISNASSAQDLGNYLLVAEAEDETNALNLYPADKSSAPIKKFDFSARLNLTDTVNPELDLEASARLGNRIFWLASHSNNKNGKIRENRYRLFATDLSGNGADASLSFAGYYAKLRDDLLNWDAANGNALGLSASAAKGVAPETDDGSGFNIEGLAFKPGSSTTYLAFRAPLQSPSSRNLALVVPVTNFTDLISGAVTASFGKAITLTWAGEPFAN